MTEENEYKLDDLLNDIIEEIPHLDSSIDYWLVRADGGSFYTDFNINSYVGIGWNEISLNDIKTAGGNPTILKRTLKDKLPDIIDGKKPTENHYGTWAGQLLRFYNNIKAKDLIVVPSEGSENFLVGRVSGKAYELNSEDLNKQELATNYKKSDFRKRYPIEWIGRFHRNDADSALYKVIYSQTTITKINDYKQYINRALFAYYIEDERLHLTFKVTQSSDVGSRHLGQFIYQYGEMAKIFDEENEVDVKVNVQSAGPIEMIAPILHYGTLAFLIFAGIVVGKYGGKFKFLGNEVNISGIVNGKNKAKMDKIDIEQKQLEKIEKAIKLAEELQVPVSELGIDLPEKLVETIDKKLEEKFKEPSKTKDSDDSN